MLYSLSTALKEREGRSAVENSADSRDDRVVKMLEEMQRNQLKQHADLIMALKEVKLQLRGSYRKGSCENIRLLLLHFRGAKLVPVVKG